MSFSKEELTQYRIERSKEALEDAKILIENNAGMRLLIACIMPVSILSLLI